MVVDLAHMAIWAQAGLKPACFPNTLAYTVILAMMFFLLFVCSTLIKSVPSTTSASGDHREIERATDDPYGQPCPATMRGHKRGQRPSTILWEASGCADTDEVETANPRGQRPSHF